MTRCMYGKKKKTVNNLPTLPLQELSPGSMKALFPLWKLMFKLSPGYFSTSKKSLLGG